MRLDAFGRTRKVLENNRKIWKVFDGNISCFAIFLKCWSSWSKMRLKINFCVKFCSRCTHPEVRPKIMKNLMCVDVFRNSKCWVSDNCFSRTLNTSSLLVSLAHFIAKHVAPTHHKFSTCSYTYIKKKLIEEEAGPISFNCRALYYLRYRFKFCFSIRN